MPEEDPPSLPLIGDLGLFQLTVLLPLADLLFEFYELVHTMDLEQVAAAVTQIPDWEHVDQDDKQGLVDDVARLVQRLDRMFGDDDGQR